VPHDSNLSGIKVEFPIRLPDAKHVIEEEEYIRYAVPNPSLSSLYLLLVGLAIFTPQFRRYDFRVI
jgi:hypothetical protein